MSKPDEVIAAAQELARKGRVETAKTNFRAKIDEITAARRVLARIQHEFDALVAEFTDDCQPGDTLPK